LVHPYAAVNFGQVEVVMSKQEEEQYRARQDIYREIEKDIVKQEEAGAKRFELLGLRGLYVRELALLVLALEAHDANRS
jgi:hypothetical protein